MERLDLLAEGSASDASNLHFLKFQQVQGCQQNVLQGNRNGKRRAIKLNCSIAAKNCVFFLKTEFIISVHVSEIHTFFSITHLNGLDSANKLVKSTKDQQWRKVPGPHQAAVPLVLTQVGPAVFVSALEELKDLQSCLHLQQTLWNLPSQNLFWSQIHPGLEEGSEWFQRVVTADDVDAKVVHDTCGFCLSF